MEILQIFNCVIFLLSICNRRNDWYLFMSLLNKVKKYIHFILIVNL